MGELQSDVPMSPAYVAGDSALNPHQPMIGRDFYLSSNNAGFGRIEASPSSTDRVSVEFFDEGLGFEARNFTTVFEGQHIAEILADEAASKIFVKSMIERCMAFEW